MAWCIFPVIYKQTSGIGMRQNLGFTEWCKSADSLLSWHAICPRFLYLCQSVWCVWCFFPFSPSPHFSSSLLHPTRIISVPPHPSIFLSRLPSSGLPSSPPPPPYFMLLLFSVSTSTCFYPCSSSFLILSYSFPSTLSPPRYSAFRLPVCFRSCSSFAAWLNQSSDIFLMNFMCG